jgi:hypothetical protein
MKPGSQGGTQIDMLKKNLEQREKPELIAIIQHMLRQEPELQWLLMTPLPTASFRKSSVDPEVYRQQVLAAMAAGENQRMRKRGEVERRLTMPPLPGHKSVPIDTEEYRSQVDAAFRHAGREWDAVYGISSDLYEITATAARFARQRDYANAAAIYAVVAMQTLSHYLAYHDEDGALGRVVQDCVEGLGACLENEREDEVIREQILEAIFAVYRFDVNHGGFGLTKDIPPEFLEYTTPEEKSLVAQWVRTVLAELQEKKQVSDWRLNHYGGLLLALEAGVLSDEEFLRIGRETKSLQEVVTRLLELSRVDEAVQDASQADGWQLLKLADLFVQHGQDSAIERILKLLLKLLNVRKRYTPALR